MLYEHRRPDVAVFIDFENVYVSVRDKLDANPNFETIMERCNELGRVIIARAYADWYRYPRITSALYANGIEPMYVPTYYYDKDMGRTGRAIKNSVDMNLCIDAMKTLFSHTNVSRFVLVTGDRDFIPLVNSIRQLGKEVVIIGIGGAASAHLAQSADEFIFYEQLVGKSTPQSRRKAQAQALEQKAEPDKPPHPVAQPPAPTQPKEEAPQETNIYSVLIDAVHLVRERGYVSTLGSLKLVMKELMGGDFKESRYKDLNGRPFTKFKEFVLDAEKRGLVQIYTSGTVNEVFLPGEDPLKLSQFAGDLSEVPTETSSGPGAALDDAVLANGHPDQSETDLEPVAGPPPASSGRSRRRRRPRNQRQGANRQDELVGAEQDEGDTADLSAPADGAGAAAEEHALEPVEPFAAAYADLTLPADAEERRHAADPASSAQPADTDEVPDWAAGQVFGADAPTDELDQFEPGVGAPGEAVWSPDAALDVVLEELAPDQEALPEPHEATSLSDDPSAQSGGFAETFFPHLFFEDGLADASDERFSEYLEAVHELPATPGDLPTLEALDEPYESATEAEEPTSSEVPPFESGFFNEAEALALAGHTAPTPAVPDARDVGPVEPVEAPLPPEPAAPVAAADAAPAAGEAADAAPAAGEAANAGPEDDQAISAAPLEPDAAVPTAPTEVSTEQAAEVGPAEAPAAPAEQEQMTDDDPESVGESSNGEKLIFSDDEWAAFRTMMAKFSKPVSFQQIFDNLRELRKQEVLDRRNEQLRTLVKQAIHNGTLERISRGSRIYYKLKNDDGD